MEGGVRDLGQAQLQKGGTGCRAWGLTISGTVIVRTLKYWGV